ncbi:MAG TPA: ABC transporter permease [Vicinamibacterales bacterium]|nr:ABC transporter permease [Vicinamibacterales bacterium]
MWNDIQYATRLLRRSPLFTATAVLSLAIGIAGNAAIFSASDALLMRALPGISRPDRLVDLGRTQNGRPIDTMSYPNFVDLRERNTVFEGVAAYRPTAVAFGLADERGSQQAYGTIVSGNYFDVVGVPMALGRPLTSGDDRTDSPNAVLVLSFQLWERRFTRDADVVGRILRVNGIPFTVVGVAAQGFRGTNVTLSEFWMPIAMQARLTDTSRTVADALTSRVAVWIVAIGRLKPDVSLAQARDEVARISRDLEREYPDDNRGRSIGAEPSRPVPSPGRTPATLFMTLLFALVFLVLLVACTNIGGLLLARGVARSREMSLRLALGASRDRIVRLLITESVLLSSAGALVGIGLSLALIQSMRDIVPTLPLPVSVEFRLDWRVVSFSILLSVGAGLVSGLLPAIETARTDFVSALKTHPLTAGTRRLRLRGAFVVAQMAMSVLLIVAALLLGRSLMKAAVIDPGFVTSDVAALNFNLRLAGYDDTRGALFADAALRRIEQLPGVVSAARSLIVPMTLAGVGFGPLRLPTEQFDVRTAVFPDWNVVSPRYFETLGIEIVQGRAFMDSDRTGSTEVVIINQTLASRLFQGQNPIGWTVVHQSGPPPGRSRTLEVVGVARDSKYRSLGEEPRPFAYVPAAQMYDSQVWILVRTTGPNVLAAMRETIQQMDGSLPILRAGMLSELTAFGLLPQRLAAWLAAAVGLITVLLAMIGIYGITAHGVAQRRREIGIRVALGAQRWQVLGMVVRHAISLTGTGAIVGLAMSAGVAQLLTGFIFGISVLDPVSFLGSAFLLGAVALIASLVPARRAASVDPVQALRSE